MNKKGFTLVELVATIVILGVILTIAVPSYNSYIEKSKERKCQADERAILDATEAFVGDCTLKNMCATGENLTKYVAKYPSGATDDIVFNDLNAIGINSMTFPELSMTDYDEVKMIILQSSGGMKTVQYVNYDNLTTENLKKFNDELLNKGILSVPAFNNSIVSGASISYLKVEDLITSKFINSDYDKYKDVEILILNKPTNGISEYMFIIKDRLSSFVNLCK